MHKLAISIGVGLFIAAVAVGAWFLEKKPEVVESSSIPRGEVHQLVLGVEGYEPEELFIKKGDVVVFSTTRGFEHWPASDVHPTHNVYSALDPRRPLSASEVWEFQFTKVGEWGIHDHLNATYTGIIHVSE